MTDQTEKYHNTLLHIAASVGRLAEAIADEKPIPASEIRAIIVGAETLEEHLPPIGADEMFEEAALPSERIQLLEELLYRVAVMNDPGRYPNVAKHKLINVKTIAEKLNEHNDEA